MRGAGRARTVLAAVIVSALTGPGVGLAEAAPASAAPGQQVTLIGDSVMAALNFSAEARSVITSAYSTTLDAKVCRRLVAPSCAYQGVTPATALQVIQAGAGRLGDIVVIDVGYNDSWTTYRGQLDQVMQALVAQGIKHVVWVTLRQAGSNAGGYTNINAAIRAGAAAWSQIEMADWNAWSAGQPWFGPDGLHLNGSGTVGLARLVRAHLDAVPRYEPRCDAALAIGTPAPPLASLPPDPPVSGARVVAVTPVRLLDTRPGPPDDGVAARLGAGRLLNVSVAGRQGVPADATGAVVNLTVVDPCSDGFASVFPAGAPNPPLASNSNYRAGQTVAGLAVARLGGGGAITIYTYAQADVIVDLVGFLHPDQGTLFHAIDPVRVFDSRPAAVGIGQEVAVPVRGARGVIPISSDVKGAVLNLTVTEPIGAGYLTLYPGPCSPAGRPLASNINYTVGLTIANLVVAPLGADGTVCVFSSNSAKVVIDAAGWMGASSGTRFSGVTPQRLVDTRPGQAALHATLKTRVGPTPLAIPMGPSSGVPADASAAVLTVTVVGPAGAGYLTAYPCSAGTPLASNVNYQAGETRPNLVTVRIGAAHDVCLVSQFPADVVVDLAGWFR